MKALIVPFLCLTVVFANVQTAKEPDIPIHGPSGEKLLSDCSGISSYNENTQRVNTDVAWPLGYCMGYISGMVDSNDILSGVTKRHGAYCVPAAASVTQLTRVVVKYGNEHPEELHLPGMLLITNALGKYFPCS